MQWLKRWWSAWTKRKQPAVLAPPSERDPELDEFIRNFTAQLTRHGAKDVIFDEVQFRIRYNDSGEVALSNLYKEYLRKSPDDRTAFLATLGREFLRGEDIIPTEFEDARPDVRPAVRSRFMAEILRLEHPANKPGFELLEFPLGEHLVVAFVYDLPQSMRFLTQDQVQQWNVTPYQLFEAAMENIEQIDCSMMQVGDLFLLANGDAYDASRILLKDRIRALPVKGSPVAVAFTRDLLLITGSEDEASLLLMQQFMADHEDEPRPLSPLPLILEEDEWLDWLPPAGHPAREKWQSQWRNLYGGFYHQQKPLLEKRLETEGQDQFVASFSGVEKEGEAFSYAVWSRSVPTWLPQVEKIAFCQDDGPSWMVEWDAVRATVGDLMQPQDVYPPRWLVDDFPTDEQFELMQGKRI